VVGGAVRAGVVEAGLLVRRLELEVVVEGDRLVGVDVPLRGPRHLPDQARARERVVEVARLALEHEGIGLAPEMVIDEVDVAGVPDRGDRVLHRVGVEVADYEEVGVPAARGVGGEPVDEGLGRTRARDVAVSLAVADVGVTDRVAVRAFRLEVRNGKGEAGAARVLGERLREDRAVEGVDECRVDRGVQDRVGPHSRDLGRLVDEAHLDRVRADRTG
jgi:hypothetical protein